jgi:nucleoside-diphosphate-sugar epimerase
MKQHYNFQKKRILVTGASGFIGSHLCRKLNKLDSEVHGVSRQNPKNFDDFIHWWQGDVSDSRFTDELVKKLKPQFIFHLASYVVGLRDLSAVRPTFLSNLLSSINILISGTDIGCERIILVGSQEEPDKGSTHAIPSSPYAAAKWSASAYARMFHALYKTPVTIARLFMVYGPGQRDIKKLIPYVTLSLLNGQAPELTSGQRLVDWIYVKDVVNGLLKIAQSQNIDGHTFDLGSGALVSIREIVHQLVRIINPDIKPLFGHIPDRPLEQVIVASIKNTYNTIGWKPETPIEKGLDITVNWFRKQLYNIDESDLPKT